MSESVDRSFTVPGEYYYVLAAAVGSLFVHLILMFAVVKARIRYTVKYPRLYHEKPDHPFNCVQRAHQNYIENLTVFIVALCVAGLSYPVTAAVMGAIYLVSRVFYLFGYSTGEPNKRHWGTFGLAAFYPLILLSGWTILAKSGLF